MTNRERFRAAMAFEPTDRPCHVEHGFWQETYFRWLDEGLFREVNYPPFAYLGEPPDLFDFFDITRYAYLVPGQYFVPPFETEVLEECDDWVIVRDARGCTAKHSKRGPSLPQFLDYPVKGRADYEALKERLQPYTDLRYPTNWAEVAQAMRTQQDVAVCTHADGFFAYPRELMGLERFLFTLYDDPQLVWDIIHDRCDFYMRVYERAIRDARPDFAFIWEDCCFANGPLISPALFEEFLAPAYRKLTSYFRDMGVRWVVVDSDGDVLDLIPLWLECGVTGLLPFEVKAGMDVVRIGEVFPRLQIIGGIDKHALEGGRADIDAELERVLPAMLARGGYIVALDHWVQPEVSIDAFEYYVCRVAGWRKPARAGGAWR